MYSGMSRVVLSAVAVGSLFVAVLLLALPLPLGEIVPPFGHQVLLALALGLALISTAVLFLIKFRSTYWPASFVLWAGIPLLGAAIVSAILAGSTRLAWWGLGFEEGTVGFFLLFALIIFASATAPKGAVQAVLYWSAGCLALAAAVFLCGVWFFDIETMAERWPQASFLFALGLALVALLYERAASLRMRLVLLAETALLAAGLTVFFHPVAAIALVGTLLLAGVVALAGQEQQAPVAPFPFLVVLFVVGLFLFGLRAPLLPVPPEVRPSFELTNLVVGESYSDSLRTMLFGTGPRSFAEVWERNRLPEINRSVFFDREFNNGYSSAITILITLGIAGFAAYVSCALMSLVTLYKSTRVSPHNGTDFLMLICAVLALYCFLTPFFSAPGSAVFMFGGLFLGLTACLSQREERIIQVKGGVVRGLIIALPLLVGGILLTGTAAGQFAAATAHREGLKLLLESRPTEAAPHLGRAAQLWPVQQYERDAARAELESVFAMLEQMPQEDRADEETVHNLTYTARTLSDRAASGRGTSWRSWLACSSLYLSLYTAAGPKYAAVYLERAQACLEEAANRAPSRPDVPYARARAAVVLQQPSEVRRYLEEALRLKPDYAPALELQAALGQ